MKLALVQMNTKAEPMETFEWEMRVQAMHNQKARIV